MCERARHHAALNSGLSDVAVVAAIGGVAATAVAAVDGVVGLETSS
jgi:hypothetical protein